MVPVAVKDVDLALLNEGGVEAFVADVDFTEDLKTDVVFLLLFEDFGSAHHGFQELVIASLFFVENVLKELQRLCLVLFLWS